MSRKSGAGTRPPNMVRLEELPWSPGGNGKSYQYDCKRPAREGGARQIGASLYRLAPGKAAFPAHYHFANEEAVLVLKGSGTLHQNGEKWPVEQGDYLVFPAGNTAHKLVNTGEEPLEYLCISTQNQPEVAVYPDSGKVGVMAGHGQKQDSAAHRLLNLYRLNESLDYYEGEE
ncbi:MAG: cupin domain-containing protein [Deltaproteobacteria bacterium]|nr:cupin domain-containing protein [Deltaproteobacteria bacterium]